MQIFKAIYLTDPKLNYICKLTIQIFMKPFPKCSLIAPTYNWPEALELLLKSLMYQTCLPDEVIIADDGSNAETSLLIKNYQKKTLYSSYSH